MVWINVRLENDGCSTFNRTICQESGASEQVNDALIQRAKEGLELAERKLGHQPRFLVVEDSWEDMTAILEVLRKIGCRDIFKSMDGEDAMNQLQKYRFDMLLLNLKLPLISGLDIIRWCRAHVPHLPTVIITGFDLDSPQVREAMALSPSPTTLNKPFTIQSVTALLAQFGISMPYERPAT